MREITFEITNFCEHKCKFCSSNATNDKSKAIYLSYDDIFGIITNQFLKIGKFKCFDRINISGGEPLAHPDFYNIYKMLETFAHDIVVYTNLWRHRRYNGQAIDGVYLEADITVTPETDKVHILRRVKQGKEANRPEVSLSRNHKDDCSCDHRVVRPDGTVMMTPCNKYTKDEGNGWSSTSGTLSLDFGNKKK